MNTKQSVIVITTSLLISLLLLSCEGDSESAAPGGSDTGKGGSMARFAISGNSLYAVNNQSMNLFNISDPYKPVLQKAIDIGWGIETIYPYKNNLFIGSSTGMFIYNNEDPSNPQFVSQYEHIFSCDPVVVDDQYAYITLRSGTSCRQGTNRLEIVDLKNLQNPQLLSTYPMTQPFGLGIENKTLFICDDGLKVYDASDPKNLILKHHFKIQAYDVIPLNGLLMVIGPGGLYQYQYNNNEVKLISKLNLPLS